MSSFRYPVEEIRTRCDIVELVSTYVTLKRSGRTLKGVCPFHSEKTPSFIVNPDSQRYRCFGCGENGDVFSFLMRMEGLTFSEVVEQLAKKAGVQLERSPEQAMQISERERIYRINTLALGFFRNMLPRSQTAVEYLKYRGMNQDIIERYRIGYAPPDWRTLTDYLIQQKVSPQDALKAGLIIRQEQAGGFYDRFRDRIIFPILDVQDRVVGFGGRAMGDGEPKYLNSPESPVFVKNRILYGLNIARRTIHRSDSVIVVEGYMDTVTVQSAGFENAVATMGTALTPEHVNILSRYTKNAYLAFDSDSAGMSAAMRSAPMFEDEGFNVRVIVIPAGQDPDSLLRSGDASVFARLVEGALPIADFRIKKIKDRFDLNMQDGRIAALKEILPILADVNDLVERERLINEIASMHPNFGTGTTLAEDHLRREVERLSVKKHQFVKPVTEPQKQQTPVRKASGMLEKAERALLGIIINQGLDFQRVLDGLDPDNYASEAARDLAAAVHSQLASLGKLELNALATEVENTPAGQLLNEILVDGNSDDQVSEPVEELLKVIYNHKKKEKLKKFRLLADKVQNGQLAPEEIDEYMRLVKELKGTSSS